MLTYLSLEGRQPREYLAELFWQSCAEQGNSSTSRQKRNNLSRTLSDLRVHIPNSFGADKTNVWSLIPTDIAAFQHAIEVKDYAAATKIYTGPFLTGYSSGWGVELEEWLFGQRECLAEKAQGAFLKLAEEAAQWQPEESVKYARSAFHLAEPQTNMLPRFYTLFEEQDSSLAREVQDLARGYGITFRRNREQGRFGQKQTAEEKERVPPHNLPNKGTSFVGRDLELSTVTEQLLRPSCRLLSLIGIGGVGKSRLALQAAYELLSKGHFQDGIYYVALEALASERLIASGIADSFGLKLTSKNPELEQLSRSIDNKHLLLILDNFEHLTPGAALLPELLAKCPNLKILVTSREHLELEEEWIFPVEGLALPSKDIPFEEAQYFDAIQLFIQRARQARLTFELTPAELPQILNLCNLVAGLPLALELAAVWVTMMTPETLAKEIQSNLDVLSTRKRNCTERHRNLRAVFEHSWNLLDIQEQACLKKLSVFRGGFNKEAAAEVTGVSLSTLVSLVNNSLLRILPSKRYDRHPLLYQYTQEKLADNETEHEQIETAHFEFFLTFAKKASSLLSSPEQGAWLERLEQDHDNFRKALTYALDRDKTEAALNLTGNLCRFWSMRGHYTEGREWLERALIQSASSPTRARAYALRNASWMAMQQGNYEVANRYATESVAICRELSQTQTLRSSHEHSSAPSPKILGTLSLEDKNGIVVSLINLGNITFDQGYIEKALPLYTESLELSQETGSKKNIAFSLIQLGMIKVGLGKYSAAYDLMNRGLALSKELGHQQFIAYALGCLGDLKQQENECHQAYLNYQQSLLLWRELGNQNGIAQVLDCLARLAAKEQEWKRATYLLGVADALRKTISIARTHAKQIEFKDIYVQLRFQLSEDTFSLTKEAGERMSLEQAISYALKRTSLQAPNV